MLAPLGGRRTAHYIDDGRRTSIPLPTSRGDIMAGDMTTAAGSMMTAEELEQLSLPDRQAELVRGVLVVRELPGTWLGVVQENLAWHLGIFVRPRGLGRICGQDAGFRIRSNPDTVRGADVAFVAADRATLIPPRGFAAFAPDLVAEILSPGDRPGEVLAKVADWLVAGTRLIWVIDPERVEAHVYRSDGTVSVIARDASLDGESVLPGFTVPLRVILD